MRGNAEKIMKLLSSLLEITDRYDAFLVDLWGVIHDGSSLYPGVREMLTSLREQKKQIVLLSNAPRRAHRSQETLAALGVANTLYDHVITSGEALYGHLAREHTKKQRYYYIGHDKDLDLLAGLPHYSRSGLATSQFLLNVGFFRDEDPLEEYAKTLKSAQTLGLPMFCANPDLVVVKRSGEILPCAGQIARRYEELGGRVYWFGKPHREVYRLALARFVDTPPERVLAVGDALETDVLGAKKEGLAAALITGGILKEIVHPGGQPSPDAAALALLTAESGVAPDYLLRSFG
jgi:HAD superfamily hydrolase (TIGR01459 family)